VFYYINCRGMAY